MVLCDGLLASSSSSAPKAVDPPRKSLSSPLSFPEAPAMLVVESEKPVMSVEVTSGLEAGLDSAVLVSEVVGSASPSEMIGSELARVPEMSYAVEAARLILKLLAVQWLPRWLGQSWL
ncbi:hypothetical protein SLA2020_285160 [Shorea laevis]